MISAVVQEAACPVIALLEADDPAMITEAAKRGVFAYVILNGRPQDLENALDITLRRYAEFMNLQGAFGRRALIEQAKGILMARNGVGATAAYELLKHQSQTTGQQARRHRRVCDPELPPDAPPAPREERPVAAALGDLSPSFRTDKRRRQEHGLRRLAGVVETASDTRRDPGCGSRWQGTFDAQTGVHP